jgi:hypothetical protein
MDLRGRIMHLSNSIHQFSRNHGILHFDEKPTYDYLTQLLPSIDQVAKKTLVWLVHELNNGSDASDFLKAINEKGLSVAFGILSAQITSQIDQHGCAPQNTPAKLINAVLIVESHNIRNEDNLVLESKYEQSL